MGPPGHAPGQYGPPPTPQQYGTGPQHGAPYGAPPPQYPQHQQRYETPPPQSAPPSPFWEDLGRERRGLWGCGAVAIVLVLALALFTAALVGRDESALGTTIFLLVFALLCAFFLFRAVPRVTTAQGIGVDASGITFDQKAKWWFKGRTLIVPWHEIVAVKNRASSISYYLRRTPPTELTPTWINHVAEGADNPESEDYSPLARLAFPSAGEQQNRLVEAVRAWRPDLTAAPRPTFHTPVPGHHGPPQAGYPQAAGHPQAGHPSAGQPQAPFEVRTKRRLEWFVGLIPALFMGLFMGAPIVILLQSATSPVDLVPLSVPGIILLASLIYSWFMVVTMPQYWAKQGVRVDAYGIHMFRERKWWFHGDSAHVGWHDIHHLDTNHYKSGKTSTHTLEIHLHRLDHELRLPSWARLLMPGQSKWRATASHRPALVLNLSNLGIRRPLTSHLRQARPDLFREQVAERAVQQHDARQQQAHWHAQQYGRAPHAPHPAHVPADWISLRMFRTGTWALGAAILLYFWSVIGFGVFTSVLGEVPDTVGGIIVLALLTVPLSLWSLRAMPRCLAQQGINVDGAGVTLVQEPFLWFEGRTAHLPWTGIRMVREEKVANTDSRLLHVFMHYPDALSTAPNWCELDNRANDKAPASPNAPLTRVTVRAPAKQRIRFSKTVYAARPDLVVTV
ncbi:hypothetical protein [Nocardiopsis nanhaiensis]